METILNRQALTDAEDIYKTSGEPLYAQGEQIQVINEFGDLTVFEYCKAKENLQKGFVAINFGQAAKPATTEVGVKIGYAKNDVAEGEYFFAVIKGLVDMQISDGVKGNTVKAQNGSFAAADEGAATITVKTAGIIVDTFGNNNCLVLLDARTAQI